MCLSPTLRSIDSHSPNCCTINTENHVPELFRCKATNRVLPHFAEGMLLSIALVSLTLSVDSLQQPEQPKSLTCLGPDTDFCCRNRLKKTFDGVQIEPGSDPIPVESFDVHRPRQTRHHRLSGRLRNDISALVSCQDTTPNGTTPPGTDRVLNFEWRFTCTRQNFRVEIRSSPLKRPRGTKTMTDKGFCVWELTPAETIFPTITPETRKRGREDEPESSSRVRHRTMCSVVTYQVDTIEYPHIDVYAAALQVQVTATIAPAYPWFRQFPELPLDFDMNEKPNPNW